MGSALSPDDMFWGHENGFSGDTSTLRTTRVNDLAKTIEFLFYAVDGGPGSTRDPFPRRAWLKDQLGSLPREFRKQALWLRIRSFRSIRDVSPDVEAA
jgi:hypothetical protein